jgi:hypothetical protein
MKMKIPDSVRHSKKHVKGKIYTYKCFYIKNNLIMYLKLLEKQEQTKP